MASHPSALPRLRAVRLDGATGERTVDALAGSGGQVQGLATGLAVLVGVLASTLWAQLGLGWVLFGALAAVLISSELRGWALARHLAVHVEALRAATSLTARVAIVTHPWALPGTGRDARLTIAGGVARLEPIDGAAGGFVARTPDVTVIPWRMRRGPALELATPAGTVYLAPLGQLDLAGWALPCIPVLARLVRRGLARGAIVAPPPSPPSTPIPPFGAPGSDEPRLEP